MDEQKMADGDPSGDNALTEYDEEVTSSTKVAELERKVEDYEKREKILRSKLGKSVQSSREVTGLKAQIDILGAQNLAILKALQHTAAKDDETGEVAKSFEKLNMELSASKTSATQLEKAAEVASELEEVLTDISLPWESPELAHARELWAQGNSSATLREVNRIARQRPTAQTTKPTETKPKVYKGETTGNVGKKQWDRKSIDSWSPENKSVRDMKKDNDEILDQFYSGKYAARPVSR